MFIRPITVKKNGKRHGYWALVESYRTRGGPRQRVVSYPGQMEESLRYEMRQQASGQTHQRMLFDEVVLPARTADGRIDKRIRFRCVVSPDET